MLPNLVGCTSTFDSLRRYLERPAKNKRNRQTEDDEQNNQTNDPVRNVEDRKDLRDALGEGPTRDDVRNADLVNVAPLQLGEEVALIHFAVCRPTTLVGSIPILRSSSGNLPSE